MKNWTSKIDCTTEAFNQHFKSLTIEALNWKPSPSTWSIAQNIDHLIVINETYFPVLSDLKTGNYKPPFIAKFGFITTLFGKMILNSVKPEQQKKTKTFSIWEPAKSQLPLDLLDKFSKHQTELKQAIEEAKDLVKKGAIISSPANKYIVYKLETAFDIIIAHEQRHLEQAKSVLELLNRNAVSPTKAKPPFL